VPLITPILFLVGVGPLARWKQADLPDMVKLLRIAFVVSLAAGLLLPLTAGDFRPMVTFGVALSVWIVATILIGFRERIKYARESRVAALKALPRGFWGMQAAHFGLAWVVAGITLVSAYGVEILDGPNYKAARGTLEVRSESGATFTLKPEKRIYNASGMPMTEAAIHNSFSRDVYAAMGEELGGGAWTVRVFHKPFINWLWIGGLLMGLGGVLGATDRRYRIALRKEDAPGMTPQGAQA
jgi:cytochrome c-type biogenesis protein CcmF